MPFRSLSLKARLVSIAVNMCLIDVFASIILFHVLFSVSFLLRKSAKMSMQPYSDEELNYFKFASIVLKEFPVALRSIFVDMWDTRVAPSSTVWDDSSLVRNILHNNEAPNTTIPKNNSFKEWDCTALFQATLYARTFALPDSTGKKKTLGEIRTKASPYSIPLCREKLERRCK